MLELVQQYVILTIVGDWGNQCTLLVCVAHSIPRAGNIFLLFYYLNVNKLLISFQSFAVVYPYDNIDHKESDSTAKRKEHH